MPDVKMPDGTVIRNVPDGTTKSQLMARLQKAQAPAPSLGSQLLSAFNPANLVSNLNEAVIGGLKGAYNVGAAVTDPIAEKVINFVSGDDSGTKALQGARVQRKAVEDVARRTFVPRPNPVAETVGEIGGSLAIPLPGKKLQTGGKLARAGYRAMQGAVGGAAVRDVDDESAADEALTGATANVVLPPALSWLARTRPAQAIASGAEKVAGPTVNWLARHGDDLVSDLMGTAKAAEPVAEAAAPAATRPLAPLGRKAEARAARLKASGAAQPTTGMVTRDPNAFAFERNTAPIQDVGEDLQQQIRDVEMSLVKRGRELVDAQGGARGPEATGTAVQKALDAKRDEMQRVTGRLYDSVRETRGEEPVGSLDSLRSLMDDPDLTDNAVFDQMRTSLSRRMERLGLVSPDGTPIEGQATVKQAEELRKFIRGLGSSIDPTVRMMRGRLVDALDDDVVNAVGDDAFKTARESAKARFDQFTKTFAGRIADEGIAPERLTKRVLSDTTSLKDLRAMRQSLLSGTEEQTARGQDAWKQLRAQALDDLISRSTNEEGKLLGGQMARDFMKQSAKFRELLEPADYKQLRRLVMASRDATVAPPGSSVNTSGTATTLANMFQGMRPKVKEGWLKFLSKNAAAHTAAWLTAGPTANLVLGGVQAGLRARAGANAANELMRRVTLAQSPEEAAAAISALREAAPNDPAVADFLDRYGVTTGGIAARESQ